MTFLGAFPRADGDWWWIRHVLCRMFSSDAWHLQKCNLRSSNTGIIISLLARFYFRRNYANTNMLRTSGTNEDSRLVDGHWYVKMAKTDDTLTFRPLRSVSVQLCARPCRPTMRSRGQNTCQRSFERERSGRSGDGRAAMMPNMPSSQSHRGKSMRHLNELFWNVGQLCSERKLLKAVR